MTAFESLRLYVQVLEEVLQDTRFVDDSNYDNLAHDMRLLIVTTHSVLRYGPILKTYDINSFPPLFQLCKTEEEVKAKNREIQQLLIEGDVDFFAIIMDA